MRVVFFGTPELAVPALEAVAASHEVAAVVCQPDRPQGRSGKPVPPPVKQWAVTHVIPVVQPVILNDGTFETWLRGQGPDVCVLVAYGRILKQPLLDVPRHGFLNLHPSLLPRHRGPSPIQSAILCGNEKTGATIMRLDAGTDTGDILLQECMPIGPDENAAELTERLAHMGARLMVRGLELLASGNAVFTPQDHAHATVTRMFVKADGQIQWAQPAAAIHNLVRAALPWPVAHCRFKGEVCRIYRTRLTREFRSRESGVGSQESAESQTHRTDIHPSSFIKEAQGLRASIHPPLQPGSVIAIERDHVVVACGVGALAILEIQVPGKKPMAMEAFMRGHPTDVGDRFEDLPS